MLSDKGMRVFRSDKHLLDWSRSKFETCALGGWSRRETKLLALLICLSQTSCVVVGYRSGGGWFVWPGALTILVVVAVLFLLARRRGR